eukprot:3543475-Prymnesium_polylepis.1
MGQEIEWGQIEWGSRSNGVVDRMGSNGGSSHLDATVGGVGLECTEVGDRVDFGRRVGAVLRDVRPVARAQLQWEGLRVGEVQVEPVHLGRHQPIHDAPCHDARRRHQRTRCVREERWARASAPPWRGLGFGSCARRTQRVHRHIVARAVDQHAAVLERRAVLYSHARPNAERAAALGVGADELAERLEAAQ